MICRCSATLNACFDANGAGGVIRVARRIYVSNLTWRTSWQDLKDHFKQAGNGVALGVPVLLQATLF